MVCCEMSSLMWNVVIYWVSTLFFHIWCMGLKAIQTAGMKVSSFFTVQIPCEISLFSGKPDVNKNRLASQSWQTFSTYWHRNWPQEWIYEKWENSHCEEYLSELVLESYWEDLKGSFFFLMNQCVMLALSFT